MRQVKKTDVYVRVDFQYRSWSHLDPVQYKEDDVKEFVEFMKDHRSRDGLSAQVEYETEEKCSYCGYRWTEEPNKCNGCCEKEIDEFYEHKAEKYLEGLDLPQINRDENN